jgi:hypothetical protein
LTARDACAPGGVRQGSPTKVRPCRRLARPIRTGVSWRRSFDVVNCDDQAQ